MSDHILYFSQASGLTDANGRKLSEKDIPRIRPGEKKSFEINLLDYELDPQSDIVYVSGDIDYKNSTAIKIIGSDTTIPATDQITVTLGTTQGYADLWEAIANPNGSLPLYMQIQVTKTDTRVHKLSFQLRGAPSIDGADPVEPDPDFITADELAQALSTIQTREGKSAYQVAVDDGFEGTIQEWLLSLVGPVGPGGGDPGKSAYQSAVDLGFVGTESAWLASLKGADGADGADGQNGADGQDGAAGADGQDGSAGASAYAVAVANGFVGTESAWLASLKGADGADGADGQNGADGKSAYEIAVDLGFVGTEEEWIASLGGGDGGGGSGIEFTLAWTGGSTTWEPTSAASSKSFLAQTVPNTTADFVLSTSQSWISLGTTAENYVRVNSTVSVTDNPGSTPRTGSVTVITGYGTAEVISHTLTINQQAPGGGGDPFDMAPLSATSDSGADSVSISLSNLPGAWTASSNKDWCTLSASGGDGTGGTGSLTASWPANAQGTRFATVTITCAGVSRGVQIQQAGDATATFTLIPDHFEFGQSGNGGMYGGSIQVANVSPSNAKWDCDSNHGWCGVSQSYDDYNAQAGTGYVQLNVNPNTWEVDRSCVVSVWSGGELRLATVTQSKNDIQVNSSSKEITMYSGNWGTNSASLNKLYPNDATWTIEKPFGCDWIKFRQDGDFYFERDSATYASGYYYGGEFACLPNTGTESREAILTVRCGTSYDTFKVTQPGGGIETTCTVSPPSASVAYNSYEEINITISGMAPTDSFYVELTPVDSWLHQGSSPSWNGDYTAITYHFYADQNSGAQRIGGVRVIYGNLHQIVEVTQSAHP